MLVRKVTPGTVVDRAHLVSVAIRLALVAVAFVGPASLASGGGGASSSAAGRPACDVAEARGQGEEALVHEAQDGSGQGHGGCHDEGAAFDAGRDMFVSSSSRIVGIWGSRSSKDGEYSRVPDFEWC